MDILGLGRDCNPRMEPAARSTLRSDLRLLLFDVSQSL